MSRFFATNSDSDTESSSSEEEIQQKPVARTFMQVSDDDEETKRVVRSNKDKRFEEIQNIIKTMRNHKKIKDMSNVLSDFEDLGRAIEKARKILDKEGIPRFVLKCLVELEDFVTEHWEDTDARKNMSKNNSKGLAALRQKVKKYNKNFETDITTYKESPDVGVEDDGDEEKDDEEESGDDDDDLDATEFKKSAMPATKDDEESDSNTDWGSSSSSESESSDDDSRPLGALTADYFLKKKEKPEGDEEKKKKKEKDEKKRKTKAAQKQEDESDEDRADGEWEVVKNGVAVPALEKPEIFSKDTEINHDVVIKKLNELMANRGKKGTDRTIQIELLIDLRNICKVHNLGDAIECKILFSIIASFYDYNPNIAASMKVDVWERCLKHIKELLALLEKNTDTIVIGEYILEESEKYDANPPFRIRGCVLTVVERMDEEFTKMLQACDAHSTEYIERLKDESMVCQIIEEVEDYLRTRATDEELCRIYLKRIQHLYYKFDFKSREPTTTDAVDPQKTSSTIMDRLCKFIYTRDTTNRIRTQAILSHIYHHALHDRYFEARDLMLMSHLQDNIQYSDIPTQILYNRTMVQLGICAFRQSSIKDAHSCLMDIQSSGRAKEFLAQGLLLQRQHERTPEQEKIEKRRQIPYHMHINLELLECVYLVSAMLIEIPFMASHEMDARKRMISKNFHHVLRVSERQALVGPPESMREHVVAACKAMKYGDWKSCFNFIVNEKMNAKVWDLFYNADKVRAMIKQKIQEESLRTYLFSYSMVYDSLSLEHLSEMFGLEQNIVHSVVSKMIIHEELMASLDEPTHTVVMHRTEPTHLQALSLQLSEKLSQIVEHNERLLDMKTAGPSYFNYQQRSGQQQGGYQQNYQQQQNYGRRQPRNRDGNRYQ